MMTAKTQDKVGQSAASFTAKHSLFPHSSALSRFVYKFFVKPEISTKAVDKTVHRLFRTGANLHRLCLLLADYF